MDVKLLLQQGRSQRQVAQLTGLSRNTVARLAEQPAPQPYRRASRGSMLDPFKPHLEKRLRECRLSAVRLLEEIRPMGYAGGVHLVRDFLATLKEGEQRQAKATVRFESPPGHQAQVDWAYAGAFPNERGELVRLYAFVMVLGFSRMLYVEFTTSMDLPTLLACHQRAFAALGGWTKEVLYDNMAQVRLPHSTEWNPLFLDFAHHYGFVPRTCRVRRPRTKGKVERAIRYVRDSFLAGRSFADLAELNAQAAHWLTHTANVRVHATTQQRPMDLLSAEGLTPLAAAAPYPLVGRSARKVSVEGFVHLEGSRYSVSPEHVGKEVVVEVGEQRLTIRAGDLVLAEHPRAAKAGACVVDPQHAALFWKLCMPASSASPAEERRWEVRFEPGVASTPLSTYAELAGQPGVPSPVEVAG
jgi:transposase